MNTILNISFDFNYLPLLIVIALAWFVPMLMSLLRLSRIPTVIVEIIAGFFLGKYFLIHFSSEDTVVLDFLALT